MIQINSILVAFDFSNTSKSALNYGIQLGHQFGARLHVLHVADVIATSAAQFYPAGPTEPEAKAIELATSQLREVLAATTAGPATRIEVRVSGSPAQEIVDYAKHIHADLIIVGTHGRTGVPRLVMGSVAEHVVRAAPCPVLVVRPEEHEFVLPDPVTVATRI